VTQENTQTKYNSKGKQCKTEQTRLSTGSIVSYDTRPENEANLFYNVDAGREIMS